MSDDEQLAAVRAWADEVAEVLGLSSESAEIDAVLGIAGLAARAAVRPAAPVTSYLLGYAVGRAEAGGMDRQAAFAAASSAVRKLGLERGGAPDSAANGTAG